MEFDENLKVPTIGKLLKKMFKEQNISFTEVRVYLYSVLLNFVMSRTHCTKNVV